MKSSFSELDLLLELEFEVINSTSGSNLWHWNTLARHLNFLVPSEVRDPLLDLSYSSYYPELVAEQQLLLEKTPLSAMHPTWLCKCYHYELLPIVIPTNCIIKWPHPQLVLLLKVLYLLTEPCKKSNFFPEHHCHIATRSIEGIKKIIFSTAVTLKSVRKFDYICGNRCKIHDEAKDTTMDEGGVWSYYQSYDKGRIDSGRTSSGRNPAFNLYIYTVGVKKNFRTVPYH